MPVEALPPPRIQQAHREDVRRLYGDNQPHRSHREQIPSKPFSRILAIAPQIGKHQSPNLVEPGTIRTNLPHEKRTHNGQNSPITGVPSEVIFVGNGVSEEAKIRQNEQTIERKQRAQMSVFNTLSKVNVKIGGTNWADAYSYLSPDLPEHEFNSFFQSGVEALGEELGSKLADYLQELNNNQTVKGVSHLDPESLRKAGFGDLVDTVDSASLLTKTRRVTKSLVKLTDQFDNGEITESQFNVGTAELVDDLPKDSDTGLPLAVAAGLVIVVLGAALALRKRPGLAVAFGSISILLVSCGPAYAQTPSPTPELKPPVVTIVNSTPAPNAETTPAPPQPGVEVTATPTPPPEVSNAYPEAPRNLSRPQNDPTVFDGPGSFDEALGGQSSLEEVSATADYFYNYAFPIIWANEIQNGATLEAAAFTGDGWVIYPRHADGRIGVALYNENVTEIDARLVGKLAISVMPLDLLARELSPEQIANMTDIYWVSNPSGLPHVFQEAVRDADTGHLVVRFIDENGVVIGVDDLHPETPSPGALDEIDYFIPEGFGAVKVENMGNGNLVGFNELNQIITIYSPDQGWIAFGLIPITPNEAAKNPAIIEQFAFDKTRIHEVRDITNTNVETPYTLTCLVDTVSEECVAVWQDGAFRAPGDNEERWGYKVPRNPNYNSTYSSIYGSEPGDGPSVENPYVYQDVTVGDNYFVTDRSYETMIAYPFYTGNHVEKNVVDQVTHEEVTEVYPILVLRDGQGEIIVFQGRLGAISPQGVTPRAVVVDGLTWEGKKGVVSVPEFLELVPAWTQMKVFITITRPPNIGVAAKGCEQFTYTGATYLDCTVPDYYANFNYFNGQVDAEGISWVATFGDQLLDGDVTEDFSQVIIPISNWAVPLGPSTSSQ